MNRLDASSASSRLLRIETLKRCQPVLTSEQLSAAAHPWPLCLVILVGFVTARNLLILHLC